MPLRFYWEIFQEFVKKYGRYPYGRELDQIKDLAKEKEASQKIVELGPKLPEDAPFSTKNPTGWMDDVPQKPSTPKKPETEAEMLDRMKRENKEAVERLKEKKKTKTAEDIIDEGDFDPSGMKDGGRIKKEKDVIDLSTPEGIEEFKKIAPGLLRREYPKVRKITEDEDENDREEFSLGGRIGFKMGSPVGGILKIIKALGEKSPLQRYKDYLESVKRRSIEGDFKSLAPELGAISAGGILVNRKMKSILEEANEQQKERFLQEYIAEIDEDPFYKKYPDLKDEAIAKYTQRLFGDKKTRTEKAGGGPSKNRLAQLLDILEGTTDLDDRRLIQQEIDQILGKYESGGRVSKGLDYLMGL